MEVLFVLINEFVLEVARKAVLDLGLAAFKEAFWRSNHNPAVVTFRYFVLGGVIGGISVGFWPVRVAGHGSISGIGLVLAALAGGVAMHAWGEYRRARGHDTMNLATFYGGGALAFSISLARFLWVE